MNNFIFHAPTKIIFGKETEKQVGGIVAEYGYKKVLVHYGQGSIKNSGLLDRVLNSLKESNIQYILFGGVQPNPEIDMVREAVSLCQREKIELILAIGGGSVIDSAKLIGAGFYYSGDPLDIAMHKHTVTKTLPVGVILTIAAAGSEMSQSAVITDPKTKTKQGFLSPLNRPLFSILNPELTYSVSRYQTSVGIVDMMMHTLERYFNPSGNFELSDYLAEAVLKSIMDAALPALENPYNYDARASLMLASTVSHNGTTNLGKPGAMPVHALEHLVSGLYPQIPHGTGLAVLFPAWADEYFHDDLDKFDLFARNVMHLSYEDKVENAKMGIARLREFFQKLGMPSTLSSLGVQEDDIPWMVNKLTRNGTRVVDHYRKPLNGEVATRIFKACL